MSNSDQSRDHLIELAKGFSTAVLVSHNADGTFAARPTNIAKIDGSGDAYFSTSLHSPKISELQANPEMLLTMQNSSQFVTLRGLGRIERDKYLINDLWSEAWRVWFPKGPDDPELCLICMTITSGEYWDNAGTNGAKYFFSAVKSFVSGRPPSTDEAQHDKVEV